MTKRIVGSILVVSILISFIIPSCLTASAADTTEISLDVKYGQTEARTMLDMVNSFRTGSEAWYWNESNSEKIYKNNLSKLEYDYNLEAIAMQRAAEIAVSFSHTRPDGTSCFTAFSGSGNTYYGENIAAGYTSASSAFVAWREDNEKYSGQGHRRNMLNANFTQIGIGHAYVNGRHYWVQEFGNKNSGVAKTAAEDGYKTVKINALSSLAGNFTTTTKRATTTTTRPSTTKQTTTKQTTTNQTTTKRTTATTTAKPTTTAKAATTTTRPSTTTTKAATETTAATTKANTTAKADLNTQINSTTKINSTANTHLTTKADSNTKTNSATEVVSDTKTASTTEITSTPETGFSDNTQLTEETVAEPATDNTLADETAIETRALPNENNTATYIGAATAAVIAAAGICAFIFIRSRKK